MLHPDSRWPAWVFFWPAIIILGGGWELLKQPGTLVALALLAILVQACR